MTAFGERPHAKGRDAVIASHRHWRSQTKLTLVQLSDIHCGHISFDPQLMEKAIAEILELHPDLVVVAGDLTSEGYAPQYRQAKKYLERLEELEMVVIPGNHDLMNVGFLHF